MRRNGRRNEEKWKENLGEMRRNGSRNEEKWKAGSTFTRYKGGVKWGFR